MAETAEPVPLGAYVSASRWLHWITAAGVVVMIALGIWIAQFEPADEAFKLRLYNIHESTGVTLAALTLVRLAVRWLDPPAPLPDEVPEWMRRAAAANHAALYVMLLVQPLIGFIDTNTWGFPLVWFGLVPIPSPIGRHEALAPVMSELHLWGAVILAALVMLHVGGALYHALVRRDGVFQRMTGGA